MTKIVFAVAALLAVVGTVLMISLGDHMTGDGSGVRLDSMDVSGLERSMEVHPWPRGGLPPRTFR